MNLRRCSLLLLLVCVCLSGLFYPGLTAHANNEVYFEVHDMPSYMNLEEEDYSNSNLIVSHKLQVHSSYYSYFHNKPFITGGSIVPDSYFTSNLKNWDQYVNLANCLYFTFADNTRMFSEGSKISFNISNVYNKFILDNEAPVYFDPSKITEVNIVCRDINGNYLAVSNNGYNITIKDDYMDISVDTAELPFDVYELILSFKYTPVAYPGMVQYLGKDVMLYHYGGFSNSKVQFDEITKNDTSGLLASIIEWLTNIRDNIVNLPSKIANSIKGFFDNIVNSVVELGNTLLDGIKSLFIPDEEYITQFYDDMNAMLSSRLGALFQVGDIISNFTSRLRDYDSESSISVPELTLNLAGSDFTIGGWEVDLLPQGFGILLDALKLVTDIGVTCMFINIMRKKYDKLVEG